MMEKHQKNLIVVLPRIVDLVKEDEYFAEDLAGLLEGLLDDVGSRDGFGPERSSDPRGDFRDGNWSLFGKIQK
jgi:hypothetical protein